MSSSLGLLAVGGMSVIIAIEAEWVRSHILPPQYRNWFSSPAISAILRIIYFLGLPYFLLIRGLLPPRFWGLSGWNSLATIATPLPVADFLAHMFNTIGRVIYLWIPDIGAVFSTAAILGGFLVVLLMLYLREKPAIGKWYTISVGQIVFDIVHWGLYRAILWVVLGNLYLASIGGMIIIAIEWSIAGKFGNHTLTTIENTTFRFALGVIAVTGFMFVQNLWLIAIAQWLISWSVRTVIFIWHPAQVIAR